MVATAKRVRFLQRQDVGRLLDDTEQFGGAGRVRANFAQLVHGEKAAARTRPDRRARRRNSLGNAVRLIAARLDHPERDPFRGARADAGHLPQLRDQFPDRGRIFNFPQGRCLLLQGRIREMQRERFEAAHI